MEQLSLSSNTKVFAYARVSKEEQNPQRQFDELEKHSYDQLFIDRRSGMDSNRPELQKMLDQLRQGDTVVVQSFDRLARSTRHLLNLSQQFKTIGVHFKSLYEQVDTSTAIGQLYFTVTSAIAEFERKRLSERTIEGLQAARKAGRIGGKPKGMSKATQQKCLAAYYEYRSNKGSSVRDVCKTNGISLKSFYRWKNEHLSSEDKNQIDAFFEK